MVTYASGSTVKDWIKDVRKSRIDNPTKLIGACAYIYGRIPDHPYLVCELNPFSQILEVFEDKFKEFGADRKIILNSRIEMATGPNLNTVNGSYVEVAFISNENEWVKKFLEKEEGRELTWADKLTSSRIVKMIKGELSKVCTKSRYKFK